MPKRDKKLKHWYEWRLIHPDGHVTNETYDTKSEAKINADHYASYQHPRREFRVIKVRVEVQDAK